MATSLGKSKTYGHSLLLPALALCYQSLGIPASAMAAERRGGCGSPHSQCGDRSLDWSSELPRSTGVRVSA
jgi:hypothetical protein